MKRILVASVVSVVFCLSLASVSFAQDPLVVGGKLYKKLFENDRIRAMEVQLKPGDEIAKHSHPDHMVYVVSPGQLTLSYPDGKSNKVDVKMGEVMWTAAESHSGKNTGTTDIKLLVVELKEPAKK